MPVGGLEALRVEQAGEVLARLIPPREFRDFLHHHPAVLFELVAPDRPRGTACT